MRHVRLAILLLAVLALAGCARAVVPAAVVSASPGALAYGPAPPPVALVTGAPLPAYTLDSGDRLRIVVFGQDQLTNSYGVDAAGNVTMPLIGAVHARGLTTTKLSRALAAQLRRGFLREPHLAVEVELYRPFFILGEVNFPGQYPYVPNMTAETAVAIGGGFTPRAFRPTVELSRPVDGVVARQIVPVITQMNPSDMVVVHERWFSRNAQLAWPKLAHANTLPAGPETATCRARGPEPTSTRDRGGGIPRNRAIQAARADPLVRFLCNPIS
jgi:polysaccharide biosynthesis/export protein